jgi:arsenate reductase (thioredoxin)
MLPCALFVCIHNAGRSQMAQAFWERLGGPGRSAGSDPAGQVHPEVLEAMRELGIDLAGRVPHRLDQADAEWADVVVTMGCGDACPLIPGKRYLDWALDDPKDQGGDAVRGIRDEIDRLITQLAAELDAPPRKVVARPGGFEPPRTDP